ncbi:DNA-3-methyladenine glycosylase I [Seminibacterium arietis]|uniref:DNA-3-methyladenine glycosylase I n=1 Tax=Seminibacterium arietis TaxID=1173502 RepID=A0ABW3I8D8_9PAST
MTVRCHWVNNSPIYIDYHDNEWSKPQYDSIKLFEQLCLEIQQAGLSWITVLKKRENYRKAFYYFDPVKVAKMTAQDINILMSDAGLVRHRQKLQAIVKNAQAYLLMEKCGENFSDFIWSFVNHTPYIRDVKTKDEIPITTSTALLMSDALKKRGFAFIGEKICYAFMQATGLVNDHLNDCISKYK